MTGVQTCALPIWGLLVPQGDRPFSFVVYSSEIRDFGFYDNQYFSRNTSTVYDLILPHIMPGLGTAARVAQSISATNEHFKDKNSFFIPSSEMMYLLPNQVAVALSQAQSIPQADVRTKMQDAILYSLKSEILREKAETDCSRCLIDTSPFFSGGTHLVWHSTDEIGRAHV